MDILEDITVEDPWQNGNAQRDDAEALEAQPQAIGEILEEVLLLVTERVSIL